MVHRVAKSLTQLKQLSPQAEKENESRKNVIAIFFKKKTMKRILSTFYMPGAELIASQASSLNMLQNFEVGIFPN